MAGYGNQCGAWEEMTAEIERLGRKGRESEVAVRNSMLEGLGIVGSAVSERERASESMWSEGSVAMALEKWGASARVEMPWPLPRSRSVSRGPWWLLGVSEVVELVVEKRVSW